MKRPIIPVVLVFLVAISFCSQALADRSEPLIIDHTCTDLSQIPDEWIGRAKQDLHVAYEHTSHGSQLPSGMDTIVAVLGNKYAYANTPDDPTRLDFQDNAMPDGVDLSSGEYLWYDATRAFLNNSANADVNVIMWSWCDIAGHDISYYLERMEALIDEYGEGSASHPVPVTFIFITGHANGGGENDSSDSRNRLIRQHCIQNNRVLFDFADMENYSPDGDYYLDKGVDDALYYYNNSTRRNWASEYLADHPGSELAQLTTACGGCAHSPEGGETPDAKLNCVLKGRAVWHMMARLAGWGDCPGDSDCDGTLDGQDGCPNDADKIQEGICGCGSPDIDTDQDQVLDCNDQCPQDSDKIEPGNCGCGIPETLTCNQIPQRPVPSLPEDSASDIELTPDLHTQAFSDPDIQDSHAGSHWQISTAENFSVLICDHQSQTDLTAFVPPEPLQEDTIYYWRVRFYDNNGGASPWSETFSFTTRSAEEAEEVDSQENKDSNEDAENYFEENGCYIMSLGF